jgi:hypothetical protein
MCLMLYVGFSEPLSFQSPSLGIESVDPAVAGVAQWFSQPSVQFVSSGDTCSCGFPHVSSEAPVESFEGLWPDDLDRPSQLGSVRALLALLGTALAPGGAAELYPVCSGDETLPPKGVISWTLGDLEPEAFFFHERFMHVVDAGAGADVTRE